MGGKELAVKDNVKILCTEHPEQFKWILTDNDNLKKLTDLYLVKGGFEPNWTTYIGRIRTGGEVLVGKTMADNDPNLAGLYVTKNGRGMRHTTFELLSFQLLQSMLHVLDVRNNK
mgnify:CR=1 FL=1